jgi:predicted porin
MYAGIESAALGAVTIGRQYSPMYDVLVKTDTFGLGSGATYFNAVGTIAGYTTRLNNSVRYETPTFAGFTGTLTYATAEDNLNVSSGKGGQFWGVKGQYENGPVYVGAAYHDGNQTTTQIATGDLKYSQAYTLGASYDFKVVKAYANFANGKTQNKELSVDMLDRAYHVGATVPFGGVQAVSLGYSKRDVRTLDLTSANDFYSVGARYTYDLSKRTKFYTAYTKGVNKGLATFSLSGAADNAGQITQAGYDPRRIELGVQHSF